MKIAEIIETLETIDNNYEIFVWERQALESAIELLERSEWIPVSERLPEEDGEYLVASGEFIYVYSYGIPLMPMNERNRRWGWYESTSEGDFYMDVDAWMPLPEPYKGGDDEWQGKKKYPEPYEGGDSE